MSLCKMGKKSYSALTVCFIILLFLIGPGSVSAALERSTPERPTPERPTLERPASGRPASGGPASGRPAPGRSAPGRSSGNIETTIKDLLKQAEITPDDYFLNIKLGWNYYLSGKYANSIHHYYRARNKNKFSLEPLFGVYNNNMAKRDYKEAENNCRTLLMIDPVNYYGTIYLSRALSAQKRYLEAKQALVYLLNFYPSDRLLNAEYFLYLPKKE